MLVRDFKGFFFFPFFHTELLATVDYPWRTNVMQLCKRFTPRTVLIFNGSAKLQLLFNWLLGWVNSEYLPVESCSVMKTLVMYGRGPSTPSARSGQRKRAGGVGGGIWNVSLQRPSRKHHCCHRCTSAIFHCPSSTQSTHVPAETWISVHVCCCTHLLLAGFEPKCTQGIRIRAPARWVRTITAQQSVNRLSS